MSYLNKWLNLRPVERDVAGNAKWDALQKVVVTSTHFTTITIPVLNEAIAAYFISNTSRFMGQINFSIGSNFTLLDYPFVSLANKTFMMIIRYVENGVAVRYVINPSGTSTLHYPRYTGQKIKGNFTVEFWSITAIENDIDVLNNDTPIVFRTSILNQPTSPSDVANVDWPSVNGFLSIATLGANLPWAMPKQLNTDGPFLTN